MSLFIPKSHELYTRTGYQKSKGYKKRKTRNPIAVALQKRGSAGCGLHKDKKKERNRQACRGKIKADNY